jgi:small subunit ribosomal protein S2
MVKQPSLREMLEAGVHFGHKTSRWHPAMEPFIFGQKNGVHIINLEKTEEELKKALDFVKKVASRGGLIVFVGTKKQAQEIVKKAAIECGMPYITRRWVGGTLTNFANIQSAIAKFRKQKEQYEDEKSATMTKKERAMLHGEIEKKEKLFGGLVGMNKKPDAFILFGAHEEKNALNEAKVENAPVVALCDTNANPTLVTYPIPANDDATKSLELFANLFSKVIKENKSFAKTSQANKQ